MRVNSTTVSVDHQTLIFQLTRQLTATQPHENVENRIGDSEWPGLGNLRQFRLVVLQ
jgi:hypothetical protein